VSLEQPRSELGPVVVIDAKLCRCASSPIRANEFFLFFVFSNTVITECVQSFVALINREQGMPSQKPLWRESFNITKLPSTTSP
jgi:hypothetical protein